MFTALDIARFIKRMLPIRYRDAFNVAYIECLLAPLLVMWQEFEAFVTLNVLLLSTNITKESIEARLRADYPAISGTDAHVINLWHTTRPRSFSQYLGEHHKPEFDYYLSEAEPARYTFFITEFVLPHDYMATLHADYAANEPEITSLLNRYRPAGRRFTIAF